MFFAKFTEDETPFEGTVASKPPWLTGQQLAPLGEISCLLISGTIPYHFLEIDRRKLALKHTLTIATCEVPRDL